MPFNDLVINAIERHTSVLHSFNDKQISKIEILINQVIATLNRGGCIFLAGNGGSFSDAQHIATELIVRYKKERKPYAAVCLGTNSSHLTAIGNDYSFDDIFARELSALGDPKDLVIAISTSGNSNNILKLVDMAISKNIQCFALSGKNGGKLIKKTNGKGIVIESNEVARIQEMHILIGHILCEAVDEMACSK